VNGHALLTHLPIYVSRWQTDCNSARGNSQFTTLASRRRWSRRRGRPQCSSCSRAARG